MTWTGIDRQPPAMIDRRAGGEIESHRYRGKRIDELSAEDPVFRGEWVYLFVLTGPRGAFVQ